MGDYLPYKGFYQRARYILGMRLAGVDARKAIKDGKLLSPKSFVCEDCDSPATEYDHRDYNKPLVVAPVCRRCNILRGAGIPRKHLPKGCRPKIIKLRDKLKAEREIKFQRHVARYAAAKK